jgi:hypothetical protein
MTMATTATIRVDQETVFTPTLFLAFELGENKWKLGCTTGAAQRPRERQVPAGDCQAVLEQKLRSLSHPLQRWQWSLSAFEDETLLQFPP